MRKRIEGFLNRIWYEGQGVPLQITLFPFALLYGVASWLHLKMFAWGIKKTKKLPVPVISVGNLTIGGTGKTPLVIYIAEILKDFGLKPAVVLRGYGGGRDGGKINIVSDGNSILLDEAIAGDEAVLLARRMPDVPVLVGADRLALGRHAINALDAEAIILDDGFQHLLLHRDLNICVVSESRGLGNGLPLPCGPLREFAGALKRADMIVLTNVQNNKEVKRTVYWKPWEKMGKPALEVFYLPMALEKNGEIFPPEKIQGKKTCVFCGIGNPDSFRKTLKELGALCVCFLSYPDHHRYSDKDIAHIKRTALKTEAQLIVTTEKDAVKIRRFVSFFAEVSVLTIAVVPQQSDNALMEFIQQASGKKN